MRSELGAALARCSAGISFDVLWLICSSAQSTRVRLGALAGEYGRIAMMSQPDSGTSGTPTRRISSLLESFGLEIGNPEAPSGRLHGECVGDDPRPEQQKPERTEYILRSICKCTSLRHKTGFFFFFFTADVLFFSKGTERVLVRHSSSRSEHRTATRSSP